MLFKITGDILGELSYYQVYIEGFRAEVTVADDGKTNAYIRKVNCAEGHTKLNCFAFKQNMESKVLEYHKFKKEKL